MEESRIKTTLDEAEGAFWAKVAAQFPEAKYGGLPPEVVIELRGAMERAIRTWVGLNIDAHVA